LQSDVRITSLQSNNKIVRNHHMFYMISPDNNYNDANNNSLVLFTELGNKKWLFTGDINKRVEKEIVKKFPNLTVDILKVAHHGSNTSTDSEFVDSINATTAFIPVGKRNRYGHPDEETITTLMNQHIQIYRTDK